MQDKRQGIASIPRETVLGGQPHMLAYINPKEERLLRGIGGLGIPGPGGVPAYFELNLLAGTPFEKIEVPEVNLAGVVDNVFGTNFAGGSDSGPNYQQLYEDTLGELGEVQGELDTAQEKLGNSPQAQFLFSNLGNFVGNPLLSNPDAGVTVADAVNQLQFETGVSEEDPGFFKTSNVFTDPDYETMYGTVTEQLSGVQGQFGALAGPDGVVGTGDDLGFALQSDLTQAQSDLSDATGQVDAFQLQFAGQAGPDGVIGTEDDLSYDTLKKQYDDAASGLSTATGQLTSLQEQFAGQAGPDGIVGTADDLSYADLSGQLGGLQEQFAGQAGPDEILGTADDLSYADLQTQFDTSAGQLSSLQEQFAGQAGPDEILGTADDLSYADVSGQLSSLQEQFAGQAGEDGILGTADDLSYSALAGTLGTTQETLGTTQETLSGLQTDYDKAMKDITGYLGPDGEYGTADDQFGALQSQYDTLTTDFGTLDDKYQTALGQVGSLTGELDEVTGLYTTQTGEFDELQKAYEQQQVLQSALPAQPDAVFRPFAQQIAQQGAGTTGGLARLPAAYDASKPLLFEQLLAAYQPSYNPFIVPAGTRNPYVV